MLKLTIIKRLELGLRQADCLTATHKDNKLHNQYTSKVIVIPMNDNPRMIYLTTTHTSAPDGLPDYNDVAQNGKVEGKAQRIGKTLNRIPD